MVKVSIIGATGYTGEELIRLLVRHRDVEITTLSAIIEKPTKISDIFPSLYGKCDIVCKELDIDAVSRLSDIVFLALPHKISMQFAPKFLDKGVKVIDLSADYRLQDLDEYKNWYGVEHIDKENVQKAVFGLPELYRNEIKGASLIANPGCYPTSVILGSAPLVKNGLVDTDDMIADSKSGVTGAGRKAVLPLCYSEVNESFKAYKINAHQHKPEISQELSKLAGKGVDICFVPHLAPMNRGILTTLYFNLREKRYKKELTEVYERFYKDAPFVRVSTDALPQIKDVVNTNFCDIGIVVTGNKAIVVACIDNLTKGAAGQAVQNMNIIYGFDEKEGLV